MATTERHREISQTMLAHAQEEFAKRDMLQASEKAWGAVAHCVKAIATERGWPNRSHPDVRRNARRLIDQTDNPGRYRRMFNLVERLHINFYEEVFDEDEVRDGIEDATSVIEAVNSADSQMAR